MMAERITSFRGQHHFLSNFHASPVELDGMEFPTVEHAYQAAKTENVDTRRKVQAMETPAQAKRYGARLKRRADWQAINLHLLHDLILQKFTRYPDLRAQLLATGNTELMEGNDWGDDFFGVVWHEAAQEWRGQNQLGKILMQVREELRREKA
jgi:ribA/ribD-fused uncharacterized protein